MDHLLKIWPTIGALASDLGLPYSTVAAWRLRGIPSKRFGQIISAAEARGHSLTYEELHAAEKGRAA